MQTHLTAPSYPNVAMVQADDYSQQTIERAVRRVFAELEISPELFRDKNVLVKPNLLMRRRPEEATTTHPQVMRAVILRLQEMGAKQVVIADSPGGLYTPAQLRSIYSACGMQQVAEETGKPAAAIELPDGEVVTGKTTDLMGAASTTLLNALKRLAGIGHEHHLISREAIEPIQTAKVKHLGSANPRLHSDEILIALAISATTNPLARRALEQLSTLRGCEAHSTVILSPADTGTYSRLGLRLTCEPQYQTNNLYHR